MGLSQNIKSIILFLMVLMEVLSSTYWQNTLSMNACRWLHFVSAIGVVILLFSKTVYYGKGLTQYHWVSFILLLILCAWSIPKLNHLYLLNSLDFTHADMLPVIKIMCQRWISASGVYTLIPEIWGGVMPVYLPAMWIPFVPAILFDFDLRWITYGMLLISILVMLLSHRTFLGTLMTFILIGLWFDYVLNVRNETLVLAEEGVVYAYYIGLVISLYKKNVMATGILVALCMLSRYGIAFYSIALLLYYLKWDDKSKLVKYAVSATTTVVLLITVTGAWGNLNSFINLSGNYLSAISTNPNKYLTVMEEGLGFSSMAGIDHYTQVYWLQIILLVLVAVVMILTLKKNNQWYKLAWLKLTLVVFYNFIVIPYPYLIYTSVWVSIGILYFYVDHTPDNSLNLTNASTH